MSPLKIILPAAVALGGLLFCSTSSYGKPEYTKQTRKACSYCHVQAAPKAGTAEAKELRPPGRYFQEHKNLDGYHDEK